MNKEIAIKSTNEFNHFSYRQCLCASTCVSINLSVYLVNIWMMTHVCVEINTYLLSIFLLLNVKYMYVM